MSDARQINSAFDASMVQGATHDARFSPLRAPPLGRPASAEQATGYEVKQAFGWVISAYRHSLAQAYPAQKFPWTQAELTAGCMKMYENLTLHGRADQDAFNSVIDWLDRTTMAPLRSAAQDAEVEARRLVSAENR